MRKTPTDFPEPLNRKKRKLEQLEIAPPPPPKEPTKEEIKAQKKRDHQLLNLLKVHLQPIMDQINRKYRKFRTPVIAQSQIQYLYDEQDPDFVRPDISQFRPFELGKDRDGIMGLRETASGKFFYNLETTTIEERLSNGFYARPKDFLADIRSLAKDAKHIGDKERTLKANELLANAEVDVAVIEQNPAMADCENIYRRQLQRAKDKADKLNTRVILGSASIPLVQSDICGEQASEAVVLGEPVPGSRAHALVTPFQTPNSLSNGSQAHSDRRSDPGSLHRTSNGSSVPSRLSDDHPMDGSNDGQPMQPPSQHWPRFNREASGLSSRQSGPNTQQSQRSAFQEIPQDMSPSALYNDASTTTSGKKTISDPSNRSSDGWSTQATNGKRDAAGNWPATYYGVESVDTEMPDTQHTPQESNSEKQYPHSQAHALQQGRLQQHQGYAHSPSTNSQHSSQPPVPTFDAAPSRPAGLANLLNRQEVEPILSQNSSTKDDVYDESAIDFLLPDFTRRSSGCTIEQLEQINRELMDGLWRLRGEWNRAKVATELTLVFNDTIEDIQEMQRVLNPSQPSQLSQASE